AVGAELGGHGERASLEVDVSPAEAERLRETQPREGADRGHRPERVAHPQEEELELVGREVARLALALGARAVVAAEVTELLDEPGVGPIVAAQLIVTWSHHNRIGSEACFARLAGVAPLPASSGLTTRHPRLGRGDTRQLNAALYRIAITQARYYPPARDYLERKRSEGKSRREALRCLKRLLVGVVFNTLKASPALT